MMRQTYDFIILGSGAAGLAAANFALLKHQSVLVLEHTSFIGGTSALSAGTVWAPNTHHAAKEADSYEQALRFLDAVVGNFAPSSLRETFLKAAPLAIATLEKTHVRFRAYAKHPDYEQTAPGATLNGRALEPLPFDGRLLGKDFKNLRPPIPEFTLFGGTQNKGMMVDRTDITHLLNLTKSPASFIHAVKILLRYGLDRLQGKRGTRLLMGNALIARLYYSLRQAGGDIYCNAHVEQLEEGSILLNGQKITAQKALILAGGGFGRHKTYRAKFLPPAIAYSPASEGHTGTTQEFALNMGARFSEGFAEQGYYTPVSLQQRKDGSTAIFPHFVLDRGKPHMVALTPQGVRFVNEATSYHNFVRAMLKEGLDYCWLITDAQGLYNYGLGMIRPYAKNLPSDAYLTRAETLEELAQKLTMPLEALRTTLAEFNSAAQEGKDTLFARGTTPYHHHNGDATHQPNPNLGAVETPPFYAIKLFAGDLGAATGLVTNEKAQVLDAQNHPLKKLYAIGNDAQSIMGGTYPAPGITLGPAIVFAYLAVEAACAEPTHTAASA